MVHLCVFGGTGPSGQCVIEEALSRGYTVTVFARNPSKLPTSITSSNSVTVVRGSLTDRTALTQAIRGANAVLSALGPTLGVSTAIHGIRNHTTPLTDGYKLILDIMKEEGVDRLIALGTVSNHAEQDGWSLVTWGMVTAVWIFLHSAWKDIVELAKAIQSSDGIIWTIARVAKLTSGEGGDVKAGYIGEKETKVLLARKDLGKWYLDELEQRKWTYQMPVIYST